MPNTTAREVAEQILKTIRRTFGEKNKIEAIAALISADRCGQQPTPDAGEKVVCKCLTSDGPDPKCSDCSGTGYAPLRAAGDKEKQNA